MAPNKKPTQQSVVTYEEIGRVHRYLLNWRNAIFAGHITVTYAHVIGYSWLINQQDTSIYQNLVLISGLFMTLIFWGLELRTRELYRACLDVGKDWEANNEVKGVYQKLVSSHSSIGHSRVLDIYFIFVLVAIISLMVCLY